MRKLGQILLAVPVIGSNNWLGGESYVRNLLYTLAALPPAERPRVRLTNVMKATADSLHPLLALDFVDIHPLVRFARHNPVSRFVFRAINRIVQLLRGEDFSIELRGVDLIFPVMFHVPGARRLMYWIGDFQEIYLPQFFSQDQLQLRHNKNTDILNDDRIVVLSSEAALSDLHENYKAVRAPLRIWQFCSLLPAADAHRPELLQPLGIPEKFAYLPNQFWVHKNHEIVIKALARLKDKGVTIPLVCTGSTYEKRAQDHFARLTAMIAQLGLTDQIRILGIVPKAQQVEILRHAAFIVQPSLFEGWSTVVEDAKSVGRPIVLSNLAVHLEQNPPNALFFDPHDVDDLAVKLETAWSRFPAGPDEESERAAATLLEQRILKSGRDFMAIVGEAVEQMPVAQSRT
jgi:glycosyltransferase involved in cell wall biosynthesis